MSSSLAVLSQIRVRATGDFCAVLVQANIHKIRHGGTKPPPVILPASNTARRVQARVLRAVMRPCLTPIGQAGFCAFRAQECVPATEHAIESSSQSGHSIKDVARWLNVMGA